MASKLGRELEAGRPAPCHRRRSAAPAQARNRGNLGRRLFVVLVAVGRMPVTVVAALSVVVVAIGSALPSTMAVTKMTTMAVAH